MGAPKNGDLWEQAWNAVLKRGEANQDLRKVEDHATNEDVETGISTVVDKIGNDTSDTNVDEGIEQIKGKVLIVLGTWIVERHDQHKTTHGKDPEDDCRRHPCRESGEGER